MANQKFYGKLTIEPGTAATDATTKQQLDSGIADAKARANHTGTQLAATISDFQTAVDARVQLIVDAAPTALDTLNELAAALGDDPNFSATVTTNLNSLDTRIDTLEASSGAAVFKATVGDAVASQITVTHNLALTDKADCVVEVVEIATGQTVYPVVTRTTTNAVVLDFGATVPASASHRVIVEKK